MSKSTVVTGRTVVTLLVWRNLTPLRSHGKPVCMIDKLYQVHVVSNVLYPSRGGERSVGIFKASTISNLV